MRTAVWVCSALLIATAIAVAQTPAPPRGPARDNSQQKPGTARLSGRVLAADTGRPLSRVVVQVAVPGAREPRWAWTDPDGRWQLAQLPAGRYTLTVSKSGYLTLRYGQLRPFEPGKALEVADGQVRDKIDVSLPKGGVIAGRIHDEFGDPVSGALVRALRYRFADGQRGLTAMAVGFDALLAGGVTDDIGQYRLRSSTWRVLLTGTVQDDRGRPIADYTVVAFSADSSRWGYRTRYVRASRPDQDGKFIVKGLPTDEYRVIALEYVESGEETDPDRLDKWKTIGTRVTLAEAEAKSVVLKVIR
jgi:hypothetical protein